ncbi:MAG: MYXO-CTERM sorting domain-containing protein, partial [Acidimicrobiales bacterium]
DQTSGGVAVQAFTIDVQSDVTPGSSGCQSAPGTPAAAGLLLLGLFSVRRRRPRRGSSSGSSHREG